MPSRLLAAHERAFAEGARRAFAKRADALRADAADLTTEITDQHGRAVVIRSPESIVKAQTAALFDECAEDVASMLRSTHVA